MLDIITDRAGYTLDSFDLSGLPPKSFVKKAVSVSWFSSPNVS